MPFFCLGEKKEKIKVGDLHCLATSEWIVTSEGGMMTMVTRVCFRTTAYHKHYVVFSGAYILLFLKKYLLFYLIFGEKRIC